MYCEPECGGAGGERERGTMVDVESDDDRPQDERADDGAPAARFEWWNGLPDVTVLPFADDTEYVAEQYGVIDEQRAVTLRDDIRACRSEPAAPDDPMDDELRAGAEGHDIADERRRIALAADAKLGARRQRFPHTGSTHLACQGRARSSEHAGDGVCCRRVRVHGSRRSGSQRMNR